MKRGRRWFGWLIALLAVGYGAAILLRVPIARPFDYVLNLGATVAAPELAAPTDGKRRVVVLVHGIFRTSASLDRLARSLRAAGYEPLAFDYPSTDGPIERHAAALAAAIEARRSAAPVDEWYLVGHSMGGLLCHEYLRTPGAIEPTACVYLAVPHRGAALAELRKRWFVYELVMGDTAAMQLSPLDAFHRRPLVLPCPVGVVCGSIHPVLNGSGAIPGPDDGTVGVFEARLEGATDTLQLQVGHTAITYDERVIRSVLAFLKTRGFAAAGSGG